MKSINLVKQFHETFYVHRDQSMESITKMRIALLEEELSELKEAIASNDRIEILDALTDIQYVLDGTYIALGMEDFKAAALLEVHSSNMTKLGADGKPIYREDGKILKGPNYRKPDLSRILKTI